MSLRGFVATIMGTVAVLAWVGRDRTAQKCLQAANERDMMNTMYASTDRLVLVPATLLDDLLELARLAADRLPEHDSLRMSLAGSVSATRACALPEP